MSIDAESAGEVLTVPEAPRAFHVMAKPTGAICNLDCAYCFFLSKEMLYPGSRFRMAADLQETYIRQLLEANDEADEVVIAWQGGEPTLMGLDFFRRSMELQRRYARPGQRILNTLQTNGTRLNDDWGAFLAENEFLVGISVDGPAEIHDTYRVSKGGKPTFARVMRGLGHLKAHNVQWNVLTTLHAANGDQGTRVYRFLRDELGAEFIQFIPIVERATRQGALVTERSIGPEQYGRFLIDVFEEWVRRDIGRVYVQMFDTALASWVGEPGAMCVHAETCGLQLVLEHNGDLYCCDHFVEPGYLLGNITATPMCQLVASPKRAQFGQDKRERLTRYCLDCDVRFACNGGCPKDRFATSPYGEPGQHYLCPSYMAFFHHVARPMSMMAELLARNVAPAELMTTYAAQDAARGRNEPCTCGSGRKWKHCHGNTPIAAVAPGRLTEPRELPARQPL
ncbi:MAG: anaerobic sulfatase maturase [Solirubrobacteraceae bacterium]|jgi:uncharacterized protein